MGQRTPSQAPEQQPPKAEGSSEMEGMSSVEIIQLVNSGLGALAQGLANNPDIDPAMAQKLGSLQSEFQGVITALEQGAGAPKEPEAPGPKGTVSQEAGTAKTLPAL